MIQVIRYTESPVGPYNELLIVPGYFEYESKDLDEHGNKIKKRNVRVSRIYVDSKYTCWNGRKSELIKLPWHTRFLLILSDWNMPKHLARFEFNGLPSGGLEVKVFPYDISGDAIDSRPSSTPFFVAKYTPILYLPYFPCSTNWMKYFGIDLHLAQPPLPEGKGDMDELPGTDAWCKVLPVEHSKKASFGWWDIKQDMGLHGQATETDPLLKVNGNVEVGGKNVNVNENWWPGFGRWRLGTQMEDATVEFGSGEHWS
jgi:hypothetical protein